MVYTCEFVCTDITLVQQNHNQRSQFVLIFCFCYKNANVTAVESATLVGDQFKSRPGCDPEIFRCFPQPFPKDITKVPVEWLRILICIRKIPGSTFSPTFLLVSCPSPSRPMPHCVLKYVSNASSYVIARSLQYAAAIADPIEAKVSRATISLNYYYYYFLWRYSPNLGLGLPP
jgi:hypothetical protein